ncbi:MAG TPA: family 10 glycosylhydrolase [Roseiflexaceae bacterium]|nr:family 10 glycosylhydrolase [Roseiflexaceae bacterium]
MPRHRSRLLACLLACLLLPAAAPARPAAAQATPPVRALWVDAQNPGFHSPAEVDELIQNAADGNINTLFVQMRRHGDAWYNRRSEPRAAALAGAPDFDPLADVLDKAHARGIAVHAWLVMAVSCPRNEPTRTSPQHLCAQHGPAAPDPERWTTATYAGEQLGEMDFGHPGAVVYTEALIQNLLGSYPALDGIHYDFIRYGGQTYGYNAVSLARFRAAYALPQTYRPRATDPAWSQWRRDRITELVRRLYIRIKAINPRTQVSAATITWGGIGSYNPNDWPNSAAYRQVFQDWPAWLNEGIVDFAVPMHYFSEGDSRSRAWYDGWLAWDRPRAGRRAIVAGTGAWLNNPQEGLSQIARALAPDAEGRTLAGVALYNYHAPISNSNRQWRREYMQLLQSSLFAGPAPAPVWPWIASPTHGHLQGIATIDGQIVPDAHITLFRDGQWARELTASVDGWYGAVELEPGSYSVQIRTPSGDRTVLVEGLPVGPGVVMSAP